MNTRERYLLTAAAATALIAPVFAQSVARRASFTGRDDHGNGKCTIEVYVDGSADVEIRGDRGFLRTLSGQPAQWRRFVCSGPMPANPGEFRFIGVDGRGRQELIQEPRGARGAAVVRIEDRDGGAEGYTFDLVWRGEGFGHAGGNDATAACRRAVEQRIQDDGYRNVHFGSLIPDNRRNEWIAGTATAQRGNNGRSYDFDIGCSVNLHNGNVRSVQVNRR